MKVETISQLLCERFKDIPDGTFLETDTLLLVEILKALQRLIKLSEDGMKFSLALADKFEDEPYNGTDH